MRNYHVPASRFIFMFVRRSFWHPPLHFLSVSFVDEFEMARASYSSPPRPWPFERVAWMASFPDMAKAYHVPGRDASALVELLGAHSLSA